MMRTFSLTLFRFDATTDYLPYTTKYTLEHDYSQTLKDLLDALKQKDVLVGLSEDGVRVNGTVTGLNVSLVDIVASFGQELFIEPLSTKRAVKDLRIDKEDFLERFDLLAPYVEKADREFFQTLILLHYATPVLKYNGNILGSAFYYFSAKMIQKYPKFEVQIADIASEPTSGVQYHLPLDFKLYNPPEDLESQIDSLKKVVKRHFPNRIKDSIALAQNPATTSLETFLNTDPNGVQEALSSRTLKHSFAGFKGGVYLGNLPSVSSNMEAAIAFSGVEAFMLPSTHDSDGAALFAHDPKLAATMAGAILLEAFDNGCDFLLVDDAAFLTLFDKEQKACAKAVGRTINFPILTADQLAFIALGEIETSGVNTHTCKPQFLPA